MGRAAGLSSQGGVDPAGARGLLGGPPGGLAVLADRVAGQPGGVAGLRLQGGLLPPEDPGRQRRADPSRGDPAGLIGVVAWSPSSATRATTSPPSGLSGCTRSTAENTDRDGGRRWARSRRSRSCTAGSVLRVRGPAALA